MYTMDAHVLPAGGEMVQGRPAFEALWKAQMARVTVDKIMTLVVKSLGWNAASEIGTATRKTKASRRRML